MTIEIAKKTKEKWTEEERINIQKTVGMHFAGNFSVSLEMDETVLKVKCVPEENVEEIKQLFQKQYVVNICEDNFEDQIDLLDMLSPFW